LVPEVALEAALDMMKIVTNLVVTNTTILEPVVAEVV
jgi:hypothetical protein